MPDPSTDEALLIRTWHDRATLVLELYGELDLATASPLEDRMMEAGTSLEPVVIDLSGLEFMDSRGVDALMRIQRRFKFSHRRLSLLRGAAHVQRLFELGTGPAFSFDD